MKKIRWHSCNVLSAGTEARQLWQFAAKGGGFKLDRTQTVPANQALPTQWVFKDWRTLFQRKLNVAWLPPGQVFLRVAQFPEASPEETRAMVELQLERLSPVPVTQIAWTVHALPEIRDHQQTLIVVIVARDVVEDFLGTLEGQGFLADRLELSLLDELEAIPIREDGAYVHVSDGGPPDTALVAWWTGGILRNLSLLHRHALYIIRNHTLTFCDTIQHFPPPQVNTKSSFHMFWLFFATPWKSIYYINSGEPPAEKITPKSP